MKQLKGMIYRRALAKRPGLLRIVRQTQFAIWSSRQYIARRLGKCPYDPTELILVSPRQIRGYIGDLPMNRFEMAGRVLGGDWDLRAQPFQGWDVYKSLVARFANGQEWEETALYARVTRAIDAGEVKWGCATREEFAARLRHLDELYEDIATHGYKSQREVIGNGRQDLAWERDSPFHAYDDVVVCIGRNGEFLLRDGKHRLSIAKILDLPAIPVRVGLRHLEWHRFRCELDDWVRQRGGKSYQPLTHPDLQSVAIQHDDNRFELMEQALPVRSGRVLDIGSYFGYFCHRFEQIGFECTAFENHPKHLYFLRKLRDAESRQFEICGESILETRRALNCEVVLALSIFHHFLITQELKEQLKGLLTRLNVKAMFFEPHLPADAIMRNAYWNPEPAAFVEFVMKYGRFSRCRRLGTVTRGRELFLLER